MTWSGFALFMGFLLAWFALNRWVLPWLGIPTCMSGGCSAGGCPTSFDDEADGADLLDAGFPDGPHQLDQFHRREEAALSGKEP
jgi:hypothetical protein